MKIVSIATLCVLGTAGWANAFVVPAARVVQQQHTLLNVMTDRRMRNGGAGGDYRMDEYYGEEGYRNRRDSGYSISPNHHGEQGGQYERYDPMRHTKEGKSYNERRFEYSNRDPRYNNDYMENGPYDNRPGGRRGRGNNPIVESADGRGRVLERYDPRAHRMNGESRFEPEKYPRTYEQSLRDRPSSPPGGGPAFQREGSYNWDQPFFDQRRGTGRRGGRANNMNGMYRNGNNKSYNSGNSGRLITNDSGRARNMGDMRDMRDDPRGYQMGRGGGMMDGPGAGPGPGGWNGGNPAMRDRQETRSTAELLKNGGSDTMFDDTRRGTDARRGGRGMERNRGDFRDNDGRGAVGGYAGNEPEYRDDYNFQPQGGDRRYGGVDEYGPPPRGGGSSYEREARPGGRRWEDPYRVGDRTMARDGTLNGPQRLDGGTRRQWTFDSNVGSVQLEMWTEGLPLMATVEIFEKGGQRKNSFDVYVEDGYSRPYSTVLDLPRQSGGTILIRNDGPVEYPLVANVQPYGGPRDMDYNQNGTQGW